MWLTARHLSFHPAVVTARFGQRTGWQRRNSRDSLAQLDEHLLRDIGVDPAKVRALMPRAGTHDGSSGERVATTLGRLDTAAHQEARPGSAEISWLPSCVSRR